MIPYALLRPRTESLSIGFLPDYSLTGNNNGSPQQGMTHNNLNHNTGHANGMMTK